jgi:hypothetical protein
VCELFIIWDGLWCPCCGYRLRTRPRNLKFKAKLRATKQIDEYRSTLQEQQQQKQATIEVRKKHISHKKDH